jgi:hypothetical protein
MKQHHSKTLGLVVHRTRINLLDPEERLAYVTMAARNSGTSVDFWLNKLESVVPQLQEQLLLREAGK